MTAGDWLTIALGLLPWAAIIVYAVRSSRSSHGSDDGPTIGGDSAGSF